MLFRTFFKMLGMPLPVFGYPRRVRIRRGLHIEDSLTFGYPTNLIS